MQTIKMRGVVAAVTGALLFGFGANAMADSTTDIVNALISKGVLTEEEGALIAKGHDGEVTGQTKALKKAGKVTISDAIDNATVYGDIRVRHEYREGTGYGTSTSAEAKQKANKDRYKIQLGVKTTSGDFYSDEPQKPAEEISVSGDTTSDVTQEKPTLPADWLQRFFKNITTL